MKFSLEFCTDYIFLEKNNFYNYRIFTFYQDYQPLCIEFGCITCIFTLIYINFKR